MFLYKPLTFWKVRTLVFAAISFILIKKKRTFIKCFTFFYIISGVQQKLEQLKAYIPFVDRMISKLESRTNHDKGEHLEKLRSLYKFLTNPDSRL